MMSPVEVCEPSGGKVGAASGQDEGKNKALISVPSSLHNKSGREEWTRMGADGTLQPFLTRPVLTSVELNKRKTSLRRSPSPNSYSGPRVPCWEVPEPSGFQSLPQRGPWLLSQYLGKAASPASLMLGAL